MSGKDERDQPVLVGKFNSFVCFNARRKHRTFSLCIQNLKQSGAEGFPGFLEEETNCHREEETRIKGEVLIHAVGGPCLINTPHSTFKYTVKSINKSIKALERSSSLRQQQ